MRKNNEFKYVLCLNENTTYLRIDLDEINSLNLKDDVLDYAVKNDKHLYIHADYLLLIEDSVKNQGKDFNMSEIYFDDLSFLDDTIKYNQCTKSKKI